MKGNGTHLSIVDVKIRYQRSGILGPSYTVRGVIIIFKKSGSAVGRNQIVDMLAQTCLEVGSILLPDQIVQELV